MNKLQSLLDTLCGWCAVLIVKNLVANYANNHVLAEQLRALSESVDMGELTGWGCLCNVINLYH